MGGQKVFLTADWRTLAMLNYQVAPALLLPFTPPGTELDSWDGKTLASLVGFRFLKTRVFGVAIPFHSNFIEINLRFYVRRKDGGEVKRGVVFIQEVVPRWAVAAVAHWFFNENYVSHTMSHRVDFSATGIRAMYEWKSKTGPNRICIGAAGDPLLPKKGSQEEFITEHYWGYARGKRGGCIEYRVEHPQWRVWTASQALFEGDTGQVYGSGLASILRSEPYSAFIAEGSKVIVYRGRYLGVE